MKRHSHLDSALIRLSARVMQLSGADASLAVLTFHRVLSDADPILASEPDAASFSAIMDLVAMHFAVLPLTEAVALLKARKLPRRALCITFDDGYASNYTVALPILAARRLPATVFVASGFLDGGRMFNDTIIEAVRRSPATLDLRDTGLGLHRLDTGAMRAQAVDAIISSLKYLPPSARALSAAAIASRAGLPERDSLMMSRGQLRNLHRAGVEIGAHTITHPILTAVSDDDAQHEIVNCKKELEAIVGAPVTLFAFPNGKSGVDYARRHVDMVRRAGFDAAFSTVWGTAHHGCDFFQMPRIAPWARSPLRYGLQIAASFRQRDYRQV